MATTATPYTEPEFKIPGYTGHIHGLAETYKKTPIPCQVETIDPQLDSFVYTRTQLHHKPTFSTVLKDPCNDGKVFTHRAHPENIWPNLQTKAIQDSFKPPVSNIILGDTRVDPFKTSYGYDFRAPFPGHDRLRSPNRNEDLARTTQSLATIYKSSYNRVGDMRLEKMISTMRERMETKCGNSNDNAFRIRKLFLAWDARNTGMIHYEDLRQMCESFGMQLDDDHLLALFSVYDPDGTGYLAYMDLVKHLMHPDTFCYYVGSVDNSQKAADGTWVKTLMGMVGRKFAPVVEELVPVLRAFDDNGTGYLFRNDLLAGCAALGVIVSETEFESMMPVLKTNSAGQIDYVHLCSLFTAA